MNTSAQKATTTMYAKLSAAEEKEDRQTIAVALETYRLGFLHLDAQQLTSIWDRQHKWLIYLAQEKEEPIYGWDGIQHYLAALPEHLEKVLSKYLDDVQIDVLGETAVAFFTSRSTVMLRGRPTKYEPISHVNHVLPPNCRWLACDPLSRISALRTVRTSDARNESHAPEDVAATDPERRFFAQTVATGGRPVFRYHDTEIVR